MGKKGKGLGGKKQKGRAGQRGNAQKDSPRARQSAQHHDSDDSAEEQPRQQFKGFAQSTPKNSPRHAVGFKLRQQAISFVSASSNTPAEPEGLADESNVIEDAIAAIEGEQEDEEGDEKEAGHDDDEDIDDSAITTNIVESHTMEGTAKTELESPAAHQQPLFFVDIEGDSALASLPIGSGMSAQVSHGVRTPSPAPSDSDEEEIVFKGRGNAAKDSAPHKQRISPHVTDDLLASLGAMSSPAPVQQPALASAPPARPSEAKGWAARPSIFEQPQGPDMWKAAPTEPYWRKPTFNKGRPRPDLDPSDEEKQRLEQMPARESKVRFSGAEGAELPPNMDAEATIAKLQVDVKALLRDKNSKRRNEAAIGNATSSSSKTTRRSKRDRKKDNKPLRNAIFDEDEDDGEEAAYNDYMRNLNAQLDTDNDARPASERAVEASAGSPAKPVTSKDKSDEWEDEDDDDDSDDEPIGQDLMEEYASDPEPRNMSDYDSSELENDLFDDEREMWEDEEDLRQRRQDAMTDEQLARLWAKQAELGIDADELMIEDGMFEDGDEEGIGDLVAARIGLRDMTNGPTSRSPKENGMRSSRHSGGFDFPDASALADTVEQYGNEAFDIMDLDRPSLRRTSKGRKSKLPDDLADNLSDEDLKDQLRSTWHRDRDRKRLKKAEREELRAQGLLGRGKNGKADLAQQYLQGITMDQVHEELRAFLEDDGKTTQSFPPMDKRDRKALHDIANMMNLKSKSVGSGKSRFPIIYKTSTTMEYNEVYFNRVLQHSNRGFLKKNKYKGGGGPKGKCNQAQPMRAGRGGGFNKDAVTIRDGEVVGGNAAEIGKESFGHKLMEKMGWSKGMALGKDGEGLLVPVAQVMRSGTRGLG